MRVGLLLASALLLIVGSQTETAGAPEKGSSAPTSRSLSDPAGWRFEGNAAFPTEDLRDALASSVDVIVASRRNENIDSLIDVVTRELTLGYRAGGYPEAEVTANVDRAARQLIISINEGKRFRQGRVEVRGATAIDVKRLTTDVTQKYAPAEAIPIFAATPNGGEAPVKWIKQNGQPEPLKDALWNPGKSASFAPSVWKSWEPIVQLFLKRQGFADPIIVTSVEAADDGTATLVIDVRDEGPRIVLGEIEVVGNEHNTTEDVLNFLQLKVGQPFDALQQARLHWRLKQAARFLKHDVQLVSPPFGDGPSRLILALVEAPGVPALHEKFTAEQQVAIRAANWLSSQRDFDWEITRRTNALPSAAEAPSSPFGKCGTFCRFILSPKDRSVLLEVVLSNAEGQTQWDQVLNMTENSGWLLAPQRREKLAWSGLTGTMAVTASFDVNPPDAEGRMSRLLFGAGINSQNSTDSAPIRDEISIAPLAMVLDVIKESNQVELTENLMTVRGETFEMSIEPQTGRLITWKLHASGEATEIRLERNLYADAARSWQKPSMAATNRMHSGAPITSLLQYFMAEARRLEMALEQPLPKWFRLAERVVGSGVLRPIDETVALASEESSSTESFSIPSAPNPKAPLGPMAFLDPMIRGLLPVYAKVFPRDTPGWTIGREAALLVLQPKGVEIASPFGMSLMLEEGHSGPLHYLLASSLFGLASPGHRIVLAQRGLRELSADAFRRDVALLMSERGVTSHSANAIAALLRGLDEPDLDELVELLNITNDGRDHIVQALKELNRRRDEPAHLVLPDLAERVWPAIQPQMESWLRQQATPPQQPPARTRTHHAGSRAKDTTLTVTRVLFQDLRGGRIKAKR